LNKLGHAAAFIALVVIAGGLGFFSYKAGQPSPGEQAEPLATAASFELPDMNGNRVRGEDFRGQWLLLNFWATWCPPCVEEMPLLEKISGQYPSLTVVGLALDDKAAVSDFIRRLPVTFPLLIAEANGSQIARQYGNNAGALPFTALVNPDGIIVRRWLGPLKAGEIDGQLAEHLR